MKQYLTLILFLVLFITACSKKDAPTPEEPDTPENPTNNSSIVDKSFSSIGGNCFAAALQPDGKAIIAGSFGEPNAYSTKLYRLNKDGGIDNSFNIDVDKSWIINNLTAVAVLNDGKILVGGEFIINGARKTLVKLNSNGALDNTFISPNLNSIGTVQPSVKQIIVLSSDRYLLVGRFNAYTATGVNFNHVAKFNYAGQHDPSFHMDLATSALIYNVLPISDGKFYISGSFVWGTNALTRQNIARINPDGSIDATFTFKETLRGRVADISGTINSIVLQSDNKIIIGGDFASVEDASIRDGSYSYRQVARLNANGSLDMSFAAAEGYNSPVSDMAVLPDDRIMVARGFAGFNLGTGTGYLKIYGKTGGVDDAFNLGYDNSTIQKIIKQESGKYILIGDFENEPQQAVLRVNIK